MGSDVGQIRWRRLSQLFDRVVDLEPLARAALIERECGDDPGLRAELERMLAADAADAALDAGLAEALGDAWDADNHPINDEEPWPAQRRLGGWQLDRLLGSGSMGLVYAAHRGEGDDTEQAAIKLLRRRWDGSRQALRFLQERRILANLSHPNIPRLLEHGTDGEGRPWFALEYIDGLPLNRWADEHALDLAARIELFREVCAAVQHAHAHFIVHRDLKPANILVDGEGHPRVLDFGVAKRLDALQAGPTRTGLYAGFTPEYAAPEQIHGGPITAATDVHALGAILYQLLSGQLPYRFRSEDLHEAAEAITSRTAEPLDRALATGEPGEVAQRLASRRTDARSFHRFVRGDLTRIVQTALAKEPQRRYASVQALSDDLRRFLQGRPVSVSGDTFAYRARKFVLRNRWGVAMASLAGLALVAGIIGVSWKNRQVQAEAERAELHAKRVEEETRRAEAEVERLAAVNTFLATVFGGADPNRSATTQPTLKEALDRATDAVSAEYAEQPQLQIRVMLAASESYDAMGERERSEALLREALRIQEQKLPQGREERALLLGALAYSRANFEKDNALRWAHEAIELQRQANPDHANMLNLWSVLSIVQYTNDDIEGALDSARQGMAFMRKSGVKPEHPNYLGALSSEAMMLAALGRHDEAAKAHAQVVEGRLRNEGADSVSLAAERSFFAHSLLQAGQPEQALAQLDLATPVLRADTGEESDRSMLALHLRGQALNRLGRHAEAVGAMARVHAYARTHPYENRQGWAGHEYARALAGLGRCAEALAVIEELRRHRIDSRRDDADPLEGSRCQG
jgi:tetratricopeptide (TPR) repeat protein/predicted Ser/Thr protein kinase